jgi:hypothetical protein
MASNLLNFSEELLEHLGQDEPVFG